MSGLGYQWHPSGTKSVSMPDEGALVAMEHAVWRVVEVRVRDEVDWSEEDRAAMRGTRGFLAPPHVLRLRPIDREDANADRHAATGGRNHYRWDVYRSEHWPACGKCGEPQPCREVTLDRISDETMRRVERWMDSTVCAACGEGFTIRQKLVMFQTNIHVPGGPAVAFHSGRRGCAYELRRYREALDALAASTNQQGDHRG